jgi:hypothetical protein
MQHSLTACLKGNHQQGKFLYRLRQAIWPASQEEQPGRRPLETVVCPSCQHGRWFRPTQPLMGERICVDLQKRKGSHTVLSSARRAESLALAASVEHLEASMLDFLCRRNRIVESGPSPGLR